MIRFTRSARDLDAAVSQSEWILMKENIPKDPRRVQTAQSPLAKFENVGLRYPTGPETLKDITFQIGQRSFQFLTGPSGAGKTSLLRLLRLTLRPTRSEERRV